MIGNNYGYLHSPPPGKTLSDQRWNIWAQKPPHIVQDFTRPPPPIRGSSVTFNNNHGMHRPHGYHHNSSPNHLGHFTPRPRYNNVNKYMPSPQQSWPRNQPPFKKARFEPRLETDVFETKSKSAKKKKPLSRNIPSKRGWTLEDAETALNIEREYNKRFKNHSLIIKFPDPELNKEIVAKFNSAIDSVHFQQPSTSRFCFVTLQPSADPDAVIEALNQQIFGDGLLIVEYKKDRDEDQVIQPTDIDPRTLYVGNLAQEVTKDDMVKLYPRSRRIDIGYAKKMKYTRYAFVGFKSVDECLESFKSTHNTEMYSKSLIVRFRRINGTVGMPGESKPHNQPRMEDTSEHFNGANDTVSEGSAPSNMLSLIDNDDGEDDYYFTSSGKEDNSPVNIGHVKREPNFDDENESKAFISSYISPFAPGPLEETFAQIQPMIKREMKREMKTEVKEDNADNACRNNDRDAIVRPVCGADLSKTSSTYDNVRSGSTASQAKANNSPTCETNRTWNVINEGVNVKTENQVEFTTFKQEPVYDEDLYDANEEFWDSYQEDDYEDDDHEYNENGTPDNRGEYDGYRDMVNGVNSVGSRRETWT